MNIGEIENNIFYFDISSISCDVEVIYFEYILEYYSHNDALCYM